MEKKPGKLPVGKLILFAVIVVALMAAATIALMPFIRKLGNPVYQAEMKEWLDSLGVLGILFVLAVQIAQIIIAVIPGEPVEILAGILYGGLGGMLLCLLGCIIASTGVFLLSKKLGASMMKRYYNDGSIERLSFLRKARNLEVIVFVLFLIPGTPKDVMTYVAGTTPMKLLPFLAISTFARIPSIVTSTYLGSSIWNENWWLSVGIFSFIALTGILGIVFKDKIIDHYKHHNAE